MAKLFVAGFSKEVDEIAIAELFIPYGQINTIKLLADKETGKSLGYGFIEMQDQAGADLAVESLNGSTFNKSQLTVRLADNGAPPKKKSFPAKRPGAAIKKPYTDTEKPYTTPKSSAPSVEKHLNPPRPAASVKTQEITESAPLKKKRPRLK